MIARTWHGWAADSATATAYARHFVDGVLPVLRSTEGFVGAQVLRALVGTEVEFRVVTYWASMDAVRRFAGEDPDAAVVSEDAARVLARFESRVRHHEVVELPDDVGVIARRRPA